MFYYETICKIAKFVTYVIKGYFSLPVKSDKLSDTNIFFKETFMNKKSDLRRALISFSWTWLAFITVMAMVSLFSIWSMNRAYEKSSAVQNEIATLEDHALKAQIEFKVQVQEWKNILLRGYKTEDREKHFLAFEQRERLVQGHLQAIGQQAAGDLMAAYSQQALALMSLHQGLGQSYRAALASAGPLDLSGARQADDLVRGQDRGLEDDINQLAGDISEQVDRQSASSLAQLHARYLALRNFIAISVIIVLVITAASLYGVLRATGTD